MPKRVLIAEDERLIAFILRAQLEAGGYDVVGMAGTGVEAVALARTAAPDIVIMDIKMPDMDGLDATRAIMETEPRCVVIITGRSSLDTPALEAGAMKYVVKPLLGTQIDTAIGDAQRRFERYRDVQKQSADLSQALENWVLVRKAVQKLMDAEGLSEDEAFERLQHAAAERAIRLSDAASEALGNGHTETPH